MEHNPRKVFYQLFGQGDTADERAALLDESGSVLDYVMESSASLQKKLGSTFVYVTHDQGEALSMADRVAVFNQGRIEQLAELSRGGDLAERLRALRRCLHELNRRLSQELTVTA